MGTCCSKQQSEAQPVQSVAQSSSNVLASPRPASSASTKTVPSMPAPALKHQDSGIDVHPTSAHFIQQTLKLYATKLKVDASAEHHLPRNYMSRYDNFAQTDRMKQRSLDGRSEGLTLEDVREAATAAQPVFNEMVRKLAEAADLDPDAVVLFEGKPLVKNAEKGTVYSRLMIGPLKDEARCREKTRDDYGGDFGQLLDVVRCSIIVDTEEHLIAVTRLLLEGGNVVRLKNRFKYALFTGYRDALFSIVIETPSGVEHVCEVQLHLAPIIFFKSESHEMYEFFRTTFQGGDASVEQHMKQVAVLATVTHEPVDGLSSDGSYDGGSSGSNGGSGRAVVVEAQDPQAMVEGILCGDDEAKLGALAKLVGPALMGDAVLLRKVEARRLEVARMRSGGGSGGGNGGAVVGEGEVDVEMLDREFAMADALDEAGDFPGAKRLYEKVLPGYEKVPGQELTVAACYGNLGTVAAKQGEYEEAKAYYQKALKIYVSKLGEDHVDVAMSYNNLGLVADDQGEYEEAKAYYQKALKIKVSKLGEDHVDVAMSYNNLGIVAQNQGEYEEAKAYYQKALKIKVSKLGEDHVSVATSYNNLGLVADHQGEYEEAKAYYQKALKIRVSKLGEDHVDVAMSYNNLGIVARHQGEYEEAKAYYQKALKMYVSKLGEDHVDVANSYNNLGLVAQNQGEYEEAKAYYQKALKIRVSKLGEDHPNTVLSKANMKSLFGSEAVDQNDITTAVGHFTRAVELYNTIPGVQMDPHVLRVKERLKELTG